MLRAARAQAPHTQLQRAHLGTHCVSRPCRQQRRSGCRVSASSSPEERPTEPRPQPVQKPRTNQLQARLNEYGKHLDGFLGNMAPKQEGDVMDVVMMCVSTAVFVYLSMQMYRLYAYAYYHAEAYRQLTDMMN